MTMPPSLSTDALPVLPYTPDSLQTPLYNPDIDNAQARPYPPTFSEESQTDSPIQLTGAMGIGTVLMGQSTGRQIYDYSEPQSPIGSESPAPSRPETPQKGQEANMGEQIMAKQNSAEGSMGEVQEENGQLISDPSWDGPFGHRTPHDSEEDDLSEFPFGVEDLVTPPWRSYRGPVLRRIPDNLPSDLSSPSFESIPPLDLDAEDPASVLEEANNNLSASKSQSTSSNKSISGCKVSPNTLGPQVPISSIPPNCQGPSLPDTEVPKDLEAGWLKNPYIGQVIPSIELENAGSIPNYLGTPSHQPPPPIVFPEPYTSIFCGGKQQQNPETYWQRAYRSSAYRSSRILPKPPTIPSVGGSDFQDVYCPGAKGNHYLFYYQRPERLKDDIKLYRQYRIMPRIVLADRPRDLQKDFDRYPSTFNRDSPWAMAAGASRAQEGRSQANCSLLHTRSLYCPNLPSGSSIVKEKECSRLEQILRSSRVAIPPPGLQLPNYDHDTELAKHLPRIRKRSLASIMKKYMQELPPLPPIDPLIKVRWAAALYSGKSWISQISQSPEALKRIAMFCPISMRLNLRLTCRFYQYYLADLSGIRLTVVPSDLPNGQRPPNCCMSGCTCFTGSTETHELEGPHKDFTLGDLQRAVEKHEVPKREVGEEVKRYLLLIFEDEEKLERVGAGQEEWYQRMVRGKPELESKMPRRMVVRENQLESEKWNFVGSVID